MQAIRRMVKACRDRRADLGDGRKYDGERSHDNHPNLALTKEALEGEGVGGVSNGQAGLCGHASPMHHEQRWEAVTQLQNGGYGGRPGSFQSIAPSCATFDAGQKVKGSLNGAEVARLCICICQPASQLSRSTTPIAGRS
ncbi:hypothetical protein V2W45_1493284 [Cenococcum geophilum]